jgi:hypothetical protein
LLPAGSEDPTAIVPGGPLPVAGERIRAANVVETIW